jgi:CBS domain containing-hemolysin-like protein
MMADVAQSVRFAAWMVVTAGAVGFSAIFSGTETGIYVINKNRLDLHAEAGRRQARLLRDMLAEPERLLATLLIGTNLSTYVATFAISAMFVLGGHAHAAEWLTMLVATPLLFVAADSVPKTVFQRLRPGSVYPFVWLLRWSGAIFTAVGALPLVLAISRAMMKLAGPGLPKNVPLGHQGVAAVVAEGHASGVLTPFQSAMANRVMHIAEVSLADTMIPMGRVAHLRAGDDRQRMLAVVREHEHSRLPIVGDDGQVTGILSVYDALVDESLTDPQARAIPPFVLSAGLTVTEALYRMRRSRRAMAVVERAGRHVGIVTIKDLVEEIVGELEAW